MLGKLAEAVEEVEGRAAGRAGGAAPGPASLDAARTRLTAAFGTSRDWTLDGARTPAAWLAGDIDVHHVRLLARARTEATAEAFERDEALLVDLGRTMRYDHFARAVAYWRQLADPDGTETDAETLRQRRRAHISKSFQGLWFGEFVLDPIAGAAFANQLDRITDELFRLDRAAAQTQAGPGVEVTTADINRMRSPAQRRADALGEMARRAATAPADGRRPDPLFTVLVGYETFAGRICQLADGTVTTPGSLLPWLDEAHIERIVFDGPSRVIDVGPRRRLFDGATRRAIEIRDQECFQKTCSTPAADCQIDHIIPFSLGGPTTQANGRPACGPHNRSRPPTTPERPRTTPTPASGHWTTMTMRECTR